MINDTVRHPGSWLDARSLMDQAAREDAAELAEHGALQPTLADDAKRAYEHFKIGVWHLEQDDPGEALRWLRTAVEQDIVEAEPLLEICLRALESVPAGRAAYHDEHEVVAAERQVGLSVTENDQELDGEPGGEATPIYDAVTDGVVDDTAGQRWIFQAKFSPTEAARRERHDRSFRIRWHTSTEMTPAEFEFPTPSVGDPFVSAEGLFLPPGICDAEPSRLSVRAWRAMLPMRDRFKEEERCRRLEAILRQERLEAVYFVSHGCDGLGRPYSLAMPWSDEWTESGLLLPSCGGAATSSSAPVQRTPDALGEVERRVAFLAARGMSGVDIAVELGLPYVTAMAHFVRACRKLGVTGREGLRAALGSGGWRDSQPDERASTSSGV